MLSLDLGTSLAYPLECQRDLFLAAARYTARVDVGVIGVLEKVQGGLQDPDVRLRNVDREFGIRG